MKRILVIDDDPMLCGFCTTVLSNEGYQVYVASNGHEGLRLLRQEPFELVITDIFMPEKEGLETIMELKSAFAGVKIIAISGGGTIKRELTLQMAKDLGADHVLEKPFEVETLINTVAEVLA